MYFNLRNFALWAVSVLLLLALFTLFQKPGQHSTSSEISYSQLLNDIDQDRVRNVVIQGQEIRGTYNDGRGSFQTHAPDDNGLIERLNKHKASITDKHVPWFVSLLSFLGFIAVVGVLTFLFRRSKLRYYALWAVIVLLLFALFTLIQNLGQHSTSSEISVWKQRQQY
jgi:cell division protease FtsH